MFRQEAAGHVERANRVAGAVEKLSRRHSRVHHSHVVRADTVVKERQRMEQETTAFSRKRFRQLRDDGLSFTADLVTKHDHYIACRVCYRLSSGVDVARLDTGLLRGE